MPIDLDVDIVDAKAAQSGEQMLDSRHGHAMAPLKTVQSVKLLTARKSPGTSPDLSAALNVEIIAGVGFGGMQDQRNFSAAMDADAFHDDIAIDCGLPRNSCESS